MKENRDISVTPADFSDMQGLVRFGHGKLTEAEFLLLTISDAHAARDWLATAPITSAEWMDTPPEAALQVAFTASGLQALGLSGEVLSKFSQPFLAGMAGEESRIRRLGDTGGNAPDNWVWEGGKIHVLLMLYAREGGLDSLKSTLLKGGFKDAFDVAHALPTRPNDGIEPFGFADGISEPKVDWDQQSPPPKHGREKYANLIAPGEIVLGHVNEYKEVSPSPQIIAGEGSAEQTGAAMGSHDFGYNGSYLVLRQLEQDVPGFWRFLDSAAGGDAAQREAFATAMVGRARDGTPLIRSRREIEGGRKGNDFTYEGDVDGVVCPVGAHIRRANPRTGDQPPGVDSRWAWITSTLGFRRRRDGLPGRHDLVASTRFHRLVRRGRAYGPPLSPEQALSGKAGSKGARGLHFVCLCADITRQFEFVQNAWMSSPTFDGLHGEADPIVGSREPVGGVASDSFSIQSATGIAERLEGLPQFVTVKGGGYFFLPGLRALRFLAGQKD